MDSLIKIHSNGLTLIQSEAIEKLPIMYQKYVEAKQSDVISSLTPLDCELFIVDLITELQVNIGHTKKAEDGITNEQTAIAVSSFIFKTHPTLTKKELKLACLMYFIESQAEVQGVNLKSIVGSINTYINSENKKKAMAEWNKMIDLVQINKYDDSQKEQIIIDGCVHFFNEYKQNGLLNQIIAPVDSLCAIFYDKLKEKGLLIFTKERKLEIYDKAVIKYKEQLEAAKRDRKMKFEQKDFDLMVSLLAENKNRPFANLCKKMSLLQYFDELVEMEQDLATLLNNQ